MKIVIPKGNIEIIHDIKSEHHDIQLDIPTGGYALLISSYYEHDPIICKNLKELKIEYNKLAGYAGRTVLNSEGYYCDGMDNFYPFPVNINDY